MKKLFASILIGILSLSLFACGTNNEVSEQSQTELVEQGENEQAEADTEEGMNESAETDDANQTNDTNTDHNGDMNADENVQTQDGTPAQILLADFLDKMDGGQIVKTEDMANALIANPIIPFTGMTMPVEPGFLSGFTEEIKGFSEAAMFGPSIGSIPFIGYIFKVDGDVDAFVQELKDKSDMRWNVCTQADETVVEAYEDTVFFLMAPAKFEE